MAIAAWPAANSFSPGAGSNESRGPLFENWLSATRSLPGGRPAAVSVIASGQIFVDRYSIVVDTQGNAATDDLDAVNMTNVAEGTLICLRCNDGSRVVRVRSGVSNITLSSSTTFSLNHWSVRLWLRREGSAWIEEHRYYGMDATNARALLGVNANAVVAGIPSTYTHASGPQATAGTSETAVMTPAAVGVAMTSAPLMVTNRAAQTNFDPNDTYLMARSGVLYRTTLGAMLSSAALFSQYVETAEHTIGNASAVAAAHNLGGVPKIITAHFRCKAAQAGYGVGMETPAELAQGSRRPFYGADTGNYFIEMSSDAGAVQLYSRTTGDLVDLTDASWRIFLRMWR